MTDWHPALTDADPADAWYPPDKLERQRQAEEKERAFRHLVERRRIFQKAVAAAVDPPQRIALASGTKQTRRPVMPLTYRTLKDAEGKPIYPDRLYTPLSSYGRAVDDAPIVFNSELTQLRGDHEAVMAAPALWVAVDTSTDEKAALRRARSAARLADVRPPRDDRFDPRDALLKRDE